MSREQADALEVLREVWTAQGQGSADLDEAGSTGRACKRMAGVGFGELAGEDEEDLRAAWRDRLRREGKLSPEGSLADLVQGPGQGRS
jgi:hypothetical protein